MLNPFEEPCRQRLAAEEVDRVGLEECPKALVRVPHLGLVAGLAAGALARVRF